MSIRLDHQWKSDRARIEKLETENHKLIDGNPRLTSDEKKRSKEHISAIVYSMMAEFLILTALPRYDNLSKQEADRKFANSSSEVNRHMKALMAKEQAVKAQEVERKGSAQEFLKKIEGVKPVRRPSLSFLKEEKKSKEPLFGFPTEAKIDACLSRHPVIGTYYKEKGVVAELSRTLAERNKIRHEGIKLVVANALADNKRLAFAPGAHLMLVDGVEKCAVRS